MLFSYIHCIVLKIIHYRKVNILCRMHVDLSVVYLRVDYKPAEFQLWQGPFTKKIFFSKKLAVNGHK